MQPTRVFDQAGQQVGTFLRRVGTADGEMILVAREELLGGGMIVVPAGQAEEQDTGWHLPYGELSMLEAPPYSPNVALDAYSDFWARLGADNSNGSASEYMPTGSGPVPCHAEVPDAALLDAVIAALREAGGSVNAHLLHVSVKRGTVLLEGYQNDTLQRRAASDAAAGVPGVREIINMLVIRAL